MKDYQALVATADFNGDGMLGGFDTREYNRAVRRDIISRLSQICVWILWCMGSAVVLFVLALMLNFKPAVNLLTIIVAGF